MTILAAALLAMSAALPAATAAKPSAEEKDDKFVLSNSHVTVWFQGKKPMLHVFPTSAGEENDSAAFGYQFTSLVEFRDVDGDGAPSNAEVVSRLDLHSASEFEVEQLETDDSVTLNLTLEDDVKLGALRDANVTVPDQTAEISLVFHISDMATSVSLNNTTFEVPATSIKYDLLVTRWPWIDAENDRLALEMKVTGALEADLEGEVAAAVVATNETDVGALTWTTTAQATSAEGEAIDVPVESYLAAEGNDTRIVFVYGASGYASLLHDPTIGVAGDGAAGGADETTADVPAPGLALVAGVVGAAALVARRRRG